MLSLLTAGWSASHASGSDSSNQVQDLAPRLSVIDDYLQAQTKAGFSGAILIASEGKILLHDVYAPDHAELTLDTEFWLGSVSKNFAAAAILKLQEQGRLKVTDQIGEHLTGIPENKRTITIHQLMTHTSGLGENYAADGITDAEQAVKAIFRRRLVHSPGDQYLYTNDGYNLLAIIIAETSGMTFEKYIQSELLEPAGMAHTGFWGDAATSPNSIIAPGLRQENATNRSPNWGYRGATGLRSSAGDLFRWSESLDKGKVLSCASVFELFTPHATVNERRSYGYGWQLVKTSRGTNAQVHTGADDAIGGFAALYRFVDEGVVIILLSNSSESSAVETLRGLFARTFSDLDVTAGK